MLLQDTDRPRSADVENEPRENEAQPDVAQPAHSFSNPTSENQDGPSDPVPLAELPDAVCDLLQLTLGGPGSPFLWQFLALAGLCSTGWAGMRLLPLVDESLNHAAMPWCVFCQISGVAWGASCRARWKAYWTGGDDHCEVDLKLPLRGPLRDLLQQTQFTPDQVSALLRWTRLTRLCIIVVCLYLEAVFALLTFMLHSQGSLLLDMGVAIIISIIGWLSSVATLFGGVFLNYVCRMAIVAQLQPMIKRVRTSTPASIDFDKLLADIVKTQHLISSISTKLQYAIVLQIIALATAGFACILIGLGPHPRDPENWWRKYHMSDIELVFGATWAISAVAILWQTSKVTSMSDNLGDAINELTEAQEPGAASVCMPTKDQQRNIEHVCSYVRGLNRGRGMGFVLYRKRISHSFAVALAMKLISVMTILFPVILSLTRVEQEEAQILNTTETCAGQWSAPP